MADLDGLKFNGLENAIAVGSKDLLDLVVRKPVDVVLVVGPGAEVAALRDRIDVDLKRNILSAKVFAVEGLEQLNSDMFKWARNIAVTPYDDLNMQAYDTIGRLFEHLHCQGVKVYTYYVINSRINNLPTRMLVPRT